MLRRHVYAKALLCLIFLVAGCGRTDVATMAPTSASTPGTTNLTYVVHRGRVTKKLEFTGRISPVEEVPLYFKAGGFVKRVLVRPGDQVKAGDLLAELEIEGFQSTSAESSLALAQARLTQAEQANDYAISQAEMALMVAQEQLSRTMALRATYTASTVSARVGVEQAEELVKRAQTEYQEAVNRPWDPPEVHEAYALALQQARWNLEIAQAQYSQAIANEEVYRRDLRIAEIGVNQVEAELEDWAQVMASLAVDCAR